MFKPTYLYVKTHNQTGLKYFGKTTATDPHKYKGSGLLWTRHIKQHGYDVTTTIIGYFEDEVECLAVAEKFSIENDIVESSNWANLKLETLDGGFDHVHSKGISSSYMKTRWQNPEYQAEMSDMMKKSWDESRKAKMRESRAGYWNDENRSKQANAMKGNTNGKGAKYPNMCYVTNGVNNKRMPQSELDAFLAENPEWRRGMHHSR